MYSRHRKIDTKDEKATKWNEISRGCKSIRIQWI